MLRSWYQAKGFVGSAWGLKHWPACEIQNGVGGLFLTYGGVLHYLLSSNDEDHDTLKSTSTNLVFRVS